MKALIGMRPHEIIEQDPHQTRYAKNLIGHTVGLGGHIAFDNYSQTLYVA